jgi:hypothetical protein
VIARVYAVGTPTSLHPLESTEGRFDRVENHDFHCTQGMGTRYIRESLTSVRFSPALDTQFAGPESAQGTPQTTLVYLLPLKVIRVLHHAIYGKKTYSAQLPQSRACTGQLKTSKLLSALRRTVQPQASS